MDYDSIALPTELRRHVPGTLHASVTAYPRAHFTPAILAARPALSIAPRPCHLDRSRTRQYTCMVCAAGRRRDESVTAGPRPSRGGRRDDKVLSSRPLAAFLGRDACGRPAPRQLLRDAVRRRRPGCRACAGRRLVPGRAYGRAGGRTRLQRRCHPRRLARRAALDPHQPGAERLRRPGGHHLGRAVSGRRRGLHRLDDLIRCFPAADVRPEQRHLPFQLDPAGNLVWGRTFGRADDDRAWSVGRTVRDPGFITRRLKRLRLSTVHHRHQDRPSRQPAVAAPLLLQPAPAGRSQHR